MLQSSSSSSSSRRKSHQAGGEALTITVGEGGGRCRCHQVGGEVVAIGELITPVVKPEEAVSCPPLQHHHCTRPKPRTPLPSFPDEMDHIFVLAVLNNR
jgi:hypothetical protein